MHIKKLDLIPPRCVIMQGVFELIISYSLSTEIVLASIRQDGEDLNYNLIEKQCVVGITCSCALCHRYVLIFYGYYNSQP